MSLKIKIFDKIDDDQLKLAWTNIQKDSKIFPQMYYEWIQPWSISKLENEKLHIISVTKKNNIVGIAPFIIINKSGLKILKTIPIHFGDFYSMIIDQNLKSYIIPIIIDYIKNSTKWDLVHFFNVNNNSDLFKRLELDSNFKLKHIIDIHEANFQSMNFKEYLLTLSRNTRSQYKKRCNRLLKEGEIQFECIDDSKGYMEHFENMKSLYNKRWKDDYLPLLDDKYYDMRNTAINPIFIHQKAVLYRLGVNDKAIAYRLGFYHNRTFYDWKVVHDTSYNYYSPANILVGKIIEDLIDKKYYKFNFMTGDYRYKKSWSSEYKSKNYEIFYAKKSIIGRLYITYRLYWRNKIKKAYHKVRKIVK